MQVRREAPIKRLLEEQHALLIRDKDRLGGRRGAGGLENKQRDLTHGGTADMFVMEVITSPQIVMMEEK